VVRSLAGLFASSLLAFSLVGCSQIGFGAASPGPTQPSAIAAATPTAVVSKDNAANVLTYSGNVQAKRQVNVVPKVAGRVTKLNVDIGSKVKAGDVIAELDTDMLDAQLAQAQAGLALALAKQAAIEEGPRQENIAMAEANLKAAEERLAALKEGGRAEQVAAAQANLQAAEAKLKDAQAGASPEQIAIAEAAVRLAKNQLYAAQAQADANLTSKARASGMLNYDQQLKEASVAPAADQVKVAEAQLASLKAPPRADQISQLQAAVDAARQQLALAQSPYSSHDLAQAEAAAQAAKDQLALAKNPYTENDRKAAKAAVDQAQAAVDLIKLQIKEATIVAPFDGEVSQRMVAVGSMVGTSSPIVAIVSSGTEVTINIEEANLGKVKVGQKATITVAAYPGVEFPATVTSIAPTVDVRSRTALARLTPEDKEGKLRDGMFAQVRLVVAP